MTQTDRIFNHLKRKGSITPQIALRLYGCMRLAARINELRAKGHGIETEMVTSGSARFARYRYHAQK